MKARELMNTDLATCRPDATLNEATRILWDNDCGFALVTEDPNGALRGVLTDRDACMAAYTKGKPLGEIPVESVMNTNLASCSPDDDLSKVHELMREHMIRRIPVVENDRAIGVISLNDLALAAAESKGKGLEEVGRTLAAICRHQQPAHSI